MMKTKKYLKLNRRLERWTKDPYGFGSHPFPRYIKVLKEWEKYISNFDKLPYAVLVDAFKIHKKYKKIFDFNNSLNWVDDYIYKL